MALLELLRKAELDEDVDFLREGVRAMAQQLRELEVAQHIGADKYERRTSRAGERNGYPDRQWDTRVGSIELRVPRVRDCGYYPALLEPRRRGERALVAVIQETYVNGVSTRRVDDLVKVDGLGCDGEIESTFAVLRGQLAGRDPEQLAVLVHERAAGVPMVQGRIRLDQQAALLLRKPRKQA